MQKHRLSRQGFTLVELSIVLVIIGLLIAGILVGQSLVESANTVKIIRQLQQDSILFNLFKERFKQYPGDFNRAVATLGARYNGNGDGMITESTSVYEHLYKAGFTKIPYDPNLAFYGPPPTKYPSMKIDGTLTMYTASYFAAAAGFGGGTYGGVSDPFYANQFSIGDGTSGALTPRLTMNLDGKIDDGKPGTGKARGMNVNQTGYTASCRTNTSPSQYRMDLADKERSCTFYVALDSLQ